MGFIFNYFLIRTTIALTPYGFLTFHQVNKIQFFESNDSKVCRGQARGYLESFGNKLYSI